MEAFSFWLLFNVCIVYMRCVCVYAVLCVYFFRYPASSYNQFSAFFIYSHARASIHWALYFQPHSSSSDSIQNIRYARIYILHLNFSLVLLLSLLPLPLPLTSCLDTLVYTYTYSLCVLCDARIRARTLTRTPLLLMYIFILMKRSEVTVCHGFKA